MATPRPDSRSTQRARILKLLIDAHGGEVPLPEILALGIAQFGARIYELRHDLGFKIVNRTERINGIVHSYFRLEASHPTAETAPSTPKSKPLPASGSGLLFGDMMPTFYHDPEEVAF